MPYLIFIVATSLLLAAFLAVTAYETAHGVRFFARERARFDRQVERVEFIVAHVDFAAFLRAESKRLLMRLVHDTAHAFLQAVRFVERVLTRLVRQLRSTHPVPAAHEREASRGFVKSLSDFKGHLKEVRSAKERELHRIG